MKQGVLKSFREHHLGILIGLSGWAVLISLIFYEYTTYGSMWWTHLTRTEPLIVIFHLMVLLAPVLSMLFGFFADRQISLQQELQDHAKQLEQKVEERTKELKWSEERYRSIVDNAAYGIAVIGLDMVILGMNTQMKKWFPHVDAKSKPICYKSFNVPPKEEICVYCPTVKTLRDGQVHTAVTSTPLGDKTVNFQIATSPIKDEKGNVVAAIEIVEDVTEKLGLEKQLKEYQADLEKKVSERTKKLEESTVAVTNILQDLNEEHKKLEKAYAELQELDRMKDDIISNISHELKTPITIVKGSIELAMEEKDPSERFELLMKAKKALLRQEPIIANLLDASLIKRGTYDFKQSNVNINRLIEEEILKKRLMSLEKKVELETSLQDGIPYISINEDRLRKAISNLLDNAIKFNKKGGKVTVATKQKGNEIEVSVADTGIGLSKEQVDKIFEPMYQVDATSTRKYSGIGLGLALVKSVVEMHGGRIWVESEPGKGSTFYFTIHKYRRL